jgi:hypothetical protein
MEYNKYLTYFSPHVLLGLLLFFCFVIAAVLTASA